MPLFDHGVALMQTAFTSQQITHVDYALRLFFAHGSWPCHLVPIVLRLLSPLDVIHLSSYMSRPYSR